MIKHYNFTEGQEYIITAEFIDYLNILKEAYNKLQEYEYIYNSKKLKIGEFLAYTKDKLGIDIVTCDSTYSYINSVLYAIKDLNKKSVHKRIKRERIRNDIRDIEATMCRGDSYSANESGYNNGYRRNIVVDKMNEKLELREKLGMITIENILHDQQQTYINSMLEKLIKQLPTRTFDETLQLEFIDGLDECEIAVELGYPTDTIIKRRVHGISALSKLLENLLKTQKN